MLPRSYNILGLIVMGIYIFLGCQRISSPANLGLRNGKLAPCPVGSNCLSSQTDDPNHFIEPLMYTGTMSNAQQKLVRVIYSIPGAKIITLVGNYLHVEYRQGFFPTVTDIEFLFDQQKNIIHLRSAVRWGFSNIRTNQLHVEELRKRFAEEKQPPAVYNPDNKFFK